MGAPRVPHSGSEASQESAAPWVRPVRRWNPPANRRADPAWPQDLGYFLGYRIAAARYAREADPARALSALLNVDDYTVFLTESGYEGDLERREGRRFQPCG